MSLRARLTLVFAAAMTTLLVGLGVFIYLRLAAELLTGIDRNLGSRADALTAQLASPTADPADVALGGGHRFVDPDEAFAQVLDPTGRMLDSTPGVAGAPLLTSQQARDISTSGHPAMVTRQYRQPDDAVRLLAVPTTLAGRPVVAVLGETLGDRRDTLTHLSATYAIAGPAAVALTCLAGWLLAGAALRPVEAIRSRAAQLSHTTPTGRLPVPGTGDELTRLALTLNDLLTRMHAAMAREHRIVDDASHELRTPLAVLKAELDLAAARPRTAAELQATLRAATTQTDRLTTLAEDLLVLARARHDPVRAHRVPTHLPTLLTTAVAPLRGRAQRSGRAIEIQHQPPDHDHEHDHDPARADRDRMVVDIDPDQITRAVQNLVDNALTHGAGDVTLTTSLPPGWLQIDVTDHGPGIPGHLLPTVFEPFTHSAFTPATPSRGAAPMVRPGAQPGTGLGLAIVHAIATAHHGTATATNTSGGGAHLRLRVHLPAPAPA